MNEAQSGAGWRRGLGGRGVMQSDGGSRWAHLQRDEAPRRVHSSDELRPRVTAN